MKCDTPMTLEEAKARLGIVDRQPIPMTNEEYLKSCNTEQLAEWIAHQTLIALLENQNNHSLRMTYPAYWVEWLKQPHTTKE